MFNMSIHYTDEMNVEDETNELYWELMEQHNMYHTEEVDRRYAEYEEDETVSNAPGDPEGCIPILISEDYDDYLWKRCMIFTNDNTIWC